MPPSGGKTETEENDMRKLISILSAASMLLSFTAAYAEDDEARCGFDCRPGTVLMTGSVYVPGLEYPSAVSVRVTDSEGELNYYDIIYTDDSGNAGFTYKNNGESGDYTCSFDISLTGETLTAVYSDFKDKDFLSAFALNAEAFAKNADVSSLKTLIEENDYWLKTDRSVFDTLSVQEEVYKLMTSDNPDYPEASDVKAAFERCAYLENVNESGSAAVKRLYEDDKSNMLFGLDELIPESGGENVFEKLSESTKNKIYSAAAGTYNNSDTFAADFTEQVLLAAISGAANYNEVKLVLEAYKAAGKISYSNTLDVSDYKSLMGKKLDSYNDVSDAVAELKSSGTNNTGGSGGGGTGGSGGGSFGGGGRDPISVNNAEKPNANQGGNGQTTESKPNVNKYFDDMEETKWALDAVNALYEKGIINGVSNRTFDPDRGVTRAEMAKMITLAAGVDTQNNNAPGFSDTDENEWYAPYISAAVDEGYFAGYGDGRFGVNDFITREQAATVVYRMLIAARVDLTAGDFVFDDDAELSDWAKNAVYSLYNGGIISGRSNAMFYPSENMTRAESAVLIYKALGALE